MSLLPLVVIGAAILFFVLKASGVLDLLADSGKDRPDSKRRWGQELLENAKDDPELNRRLQVFKEFLDEKSDAEDPSDGE
ncbi:MAG: hypothetical protein P1P76_03115 [Anaerolineales bacterium]|nr:hypothetical protein [Anaerolineales bacterium]